MKPDPLLIVIIGNVRAAGPGGCTIGWPIHEIKDMATAHKREVLVYCAQHAPETSAWRFDPELCGPCGVMKQASLPLLAGEG